MRGLRFLSLALWVAGCPKGGPPTNTFTIEAAKGGTVKSADGAVVIEIPPASLASDTAVTLRKLEPSEWPAEVRDSSPLGDVYSIEPDGLVFRVPAKLTQTLPSPPAGMIDAAAGSVRMPGHAMRSATGTIEDASTSTRFAPDGSLVVTAELPHASVHWLRFNAYSIFHSPYGGTHEVDESWFLTLLRVNADAQSNLAGYDVYSVTGVPVAEQTPAVVPMPRSYGMRNDIFFGLKVYTGTDARPGGVALGPGMPLSAAAPLPGWLCVEVGMALTSAGVVLHLQNGVSLDLHLPDEVVDCVAKTSMNPQPGAAYARDCSRLPFELTPVAGRQGELGVLCLPFDGGCFFTNDVAQSLPLAPTQCATGERALVVTHDGTQGTVNAFGGYRFAYASTGTDVAQASTAPRDGTAESVVLHHVPDGGRWVFDYSLDAGAIHVGRAARHTGLLPRYGAVIDAADTPQTFATPITVGQAQVFVRICFEQTGLYFHGDIAATPENESCKAGSYAAALLVNASGPAFDATHPSTSTTWAVTESSHGTIASNSVTGLPTGVDVTTTISGPFGGAVIVYRYTGSGFIVQSVTRQ